MVMQSASSPLDEVLDAIDDAATRYGCTLATAARAYLVQPAAQYFQATPRALPLDRSKLDAQMNEIFEKLGQQKGILRGLTIEEADFIAVRPIIACHYLWFC